MAETPQIESNQPNQPENTIERRGNIATIKKPEGIYSIAYGIHTIEKEQAVPAGVDGICFEWAGTYPTTREGLLGLAMGNQKSLFDYARHNKLFLLATDCSINFDAISLEQLVTPLEFIMGSYLYSKMREAAAKKGKTRREFLKQMIVGGVSLYLTLPAVSNLARRESTLRGIGEGQTSELLKTTQKMHPELNILTLGLRDAVAAQKMQFLLKDEHFQHLLASRGAAHVGLETAILSQEADRMDFLKRLKPVLPKVMPDLKTLYQIYKYQPLDNGQWKIAVISEEPKLKQLVSEEPVRKLIAT